MPEPKLKTTYRRTMQARLGLDDCCFSVIWNEPSMIAARTRMAAQIRSHRRISTKKARDRWTEVKLLVERHGKRPDA